MVCFALTLILMPSCIEYVTTFLACLYAGVVAIPAYPPRNNYHAQRIAIIARDADVTASLVMSDKRDSITSYLSQALSDVPNVIAVDDLVLGEGGWVNEAVRSEDLAYLQYTSGSTGDPKGVMVRHGDLVGNSALYSVGAGLKRGETFVSWLPIFHDMGLIQGIVLPLTLGGQAVFMAPETFVSKPLLWLKAIDRYRAAFSGAPNFAYQLCVDKVSLEAAAQLDLSHWRVALNAAEPISCQTTDAFIRKFATSGFRRETMVGGFGLAEATLYVTCGKGDQYRASLSVARKALEQNHAELMSEEGVDAMLMHSSGSVCDDPKVVIVEPTQYVSCSDRAVGEIWVSGSSVCGGYWNRPEESLATFFATLESHPGMTFMRTGDLGFINESELYVTGRLKDLIIVRGANHYPQDLEKTAQQIHRSLRPSGAAFSVEKDGRTQIILAQEVKRNARHNFDFKTVGRAIEQRISEAHGVLIDAVVFLPPYGVPKTSSGKTQRKACRTMYLKGTLKQIGAWVRPVITQDTKYSISTDLLNKRPLLMKWISALVASLVGGGC